MIYYLIDGFGVIAKVSQDSFTKLCKHQHSMSCVRIFIVCQEEYNYE